MSQDLVYNCFPCREMGIKMHSSVRSFWKVRCSKSISLRSEHSSQWSQWILFLASSNFNIFIQDECFFLQIINQVCWLYITPLVFVTLLIDELYRYRKMLFQNPSYLLLGLTLGLLVFVEGIILLLIGVSMWPWKDMLLVWKKLLHRHGRDFDLHQPRGEGIRGRSDGGQKTSKACSTSWLSSHWGHCGQQRYCDQRHYHDRHCYYHSTSMWIYFVLQ